MADSNRRQDKSQVGENQELETKKAHILIFSIQHKQKSLYMVNTHLCRYQLLRD